MVVKNFRRMTDYVILQEVAPRLKRLRLNRNLTRDEISALSGKAKNTIKNLENGIGTLASLIAILLALDALDQLNYLVPDPGISPILLLKQPQPRQRARKASVK